MDKMTILRLGYKSFLKKAVGNGVERKNTAINDKATHCEKPKYPVKVPNFAAFEFFTSGD